MRGGRWGWSTGGDHVTPSALERTTLVQLSYCVATRQREKWIQNTRVSSSKTAMTLL